MIDLSRYVFEALRKDEHFCLYRGRSNDAGSRVLVLSPVTEYPAPEILKWLEHAYSLREELDPTWAARPIAIARHWDRTVLVLEDPGGVPLDQLLGQPLQVGFWLRLAINLSTAIGHLHERGVIHKDIKPANVLVNPVTGQCWLRGFRYCLAAPTRAPVCRTSRVHSRNARLHGARADRTYESFHRFPKRSLFTRRHAVRNADRESSLHGFRPHGMGALPYCETASSA